MVAGRRESESNVARARKPGLADLIQSMGGWGGPDARNFQDRGGSRIYSREDSPRHPAVRPTEYIWSRIKGWYGARYGAVGVLEYVQSFCAEISVPDLANIAGLCDKVASIMADEEAAIFLDDDISRGAGSGESDSGDDGAMPVI